MVWFWQIAKHPSTGYCPFSSVIKHLKIQKNKFCFSNSMYTLCTVILRSSVLWSQIQAEKSFFSFFCLRSVVTSLSNATCLLGITHTHTHTPWAASQHLQFFTRVSTLYKRVQQKAYKESIDQKRTILEHILEKNPLYSHLLDHTNGKP